MAEYGYIISQNDIAKHLKKFNRTYDNNRTWSEMYGTVDLAGQAQKSQVTQDYSEQIGDAYRVAHGQKAALNASALGSGFKQQGFADIENSLRQAYDSYRNTYESSLATIDSNVQTATDSITSSLTEQSGNIKNYIDAMYGYLENLYTKAAGTEDVAGDTYLEGLISDKYSNSGWNEWFNLVAEDGSEITDARQLSTSEMRLLSKSELFNKFMDENGNINDSGKLFFKEMLDGFSEAEGSKYSFGSYLAETNPELLEWATSTNTYDSNFANNDALVREYLGITDYKVPVKEKEPEVEEPKEEPKVEKSEVNDSPYTEQPGALYDNEEINLEFLNMMNDKGITDTTIFYVPNETLSYATGDAPKHDFGYLLDVGKKLGLDTRGWKTPKDAYTALSKYREEYNSSRISQKYGDGNTKKTTSRYIKFGHN